LKRPGFDWALPGGRLRLDGRTLLMGVVNVTPDSFHDGGRHFSPERALERVWRLIEEGADVIDLGGESTRPFSDGINEEEELRRVLPVIEALAGRSPVPLSIDTVKAGVARRALEAGAGIINDISGLRADPAMIPLAARTGAGVVLMHMRGSPKDMQLRTDYQDLIAEIKAELNSALEAALAGGVRPEAVVLDPGIGFAKKPEHNLEIIRRLPEFLDLGRPLLVGASRKSFTGLVLEGFGLAHQTEDRLLASLAAAALAAFQGAHLIRVHDVAETRQALALADAVREGALPEFERRD